MYDFTCSPADIAGDHCEDLKRSLMDILMQILDRILDHVVQNQDWGNRELYQQKQELCELYHEIARMDCDTLRRRYNELRNRVHDIGRSDGQKASPLKQFWDDLDLAESLKGQLLDYFMDSMQHTRLGQLLSSFNLEEAQKKADVYADIYGEVVRGFTGQAPDMEKVFDAMQSLLDDVPGFEYLPPLGKLAVADISRELGLSGARRLAKHIERDTAHPFHHLFEYLPYDRFPFDRGLAWVEPVWLYGKTYGRFRSAEGDTTFKHNPFDLSSGPNQVEISKRLADISPGSRFAFFYRVGRVYGGSGTRKGISILVGSGIESGWFLAYGADTSLESGCLIVNGEYRDDLAFPIGKGRTRQPYSYALLFYLRTGEIHLRIDACNIERNIKTSFEERPVHAGAVSSHVSFSQHSGDMLT